MNRIFVFKLGSSSITSTDGPDPVALARAMVECAEAQRAGWAPLIVTSGSRALGEVLLGSAARGAGRGLAAAVGQPELMQMFAFNGHTRGVRTCQVLVSEADLRSPAAMVRLGDLLASCCALGLIPIVNGNDPTDTQALNNDDLAAAIAIMVRAEQLILLTDVPGVFIGPNEHAGGIEAELSRSTAGKVPNLGTSATGTGGMSQKVEAASRAAYSGVRVTIAGHTGYKLLDTLGRQQVGTRLGPWGPRTGDSFSRWVGGAAPSDGRLTINREAEDSVRSGQSLFSSGVKRVSGTFTRGSVVDIIDPRKQLIGRGRVRVSDGIISLLRALTPKEGAAVFVAILQADSGTADSSVSTLSEVSDRPQFLAAIGSIAGMTPDRVRKITNELVGLIPQAAAASLARDGKQSAGSPVAMIERHTAYLSLVDREALVPFQPEDKNFDTG